MTSNKSQRSTPAKHYEKNNISLLKLKLLFLHEHFIAGFFDQVSSRKSRKHFFDNSSSRNKKA